jgi:hypothetical protein
MTEHSLAEPIHRQDDGELLGFVTNTKNAWSARTIFGYEFAVTESRDDAIRQVKEKGLSFLMGVWQFYDKHSKEWRPCIIKEARPDQVTIIRTNMFGLEDPDERGMQTISNPTSMWLRK